MNTAASEYRPSWMTSGKGSIDPPTILDDDDSSLVDDAAAALGGLNVTAREWAPPAASSASLPAAAPTRAEELAKLQALANSINADAAIALLSGASSSTSYVNTAPAFSAVAARLGSAGASSPAPTDGGDADEANLDEIEAALAAAEIEAFLDAQGAWAVGGAHMLFSHPLSTVSTVAFNGQFSFWRTPGVTNEDERNSIAFELLQSRNAGGGGDDDAGAGMIWRSRRHTYYYCSGSVSALLSRSPWPILFTPSVSATPFFLCPIVQSRRTRSSLGLSPHPHTADAVPSGAAFTPPPPPSPPRQPRHPRHPSPRLQ